MNEETDRLNRLVGEAAEMAQLDAGEVELNLAPYPISEVVAEALEQLRTALAGREVRVNVAPGLPNVRVDLVRARDAVTQLIDNAARYSPPNEPITVTAELVPGGDFVLTSVADRGDGVDEPEHSLIFEKFYRGKENQIFGAGNWDGAADCESHYRSAPRDNFGDEPARKRHGVFVHSAGGSCRRARRCQSMSTATILVVDDEPQIRRTMRTTLASHGYTVIEALSGEEALEKIRGDEKVDLVLLDVNLPKMSGVETCRELRATGDVPIIMLTVRNSERDKVMALDAGADDYVVKPFSVEELMARIRAALRRVAAGETSSAV